MKNMINHFMGAAVLAGLTAMSNGAFAHVDKVETGATRVFPELSNPQPLPEVPPAAEDTGPLAFSRFVEKAKIKSFIISGFSFLESSQKLVDDVQAKGIVIANVCSFLNSKEMLSLPKKLKEDFNQSFEKLANLGDVTPEIKAVAVKEFDGIMDTLEKNNNYIRYKCLNPGLDT